MIPVLAGSRVGLPGPPGPSLVLVREEREGRGVYSRTPPPPSMGSDRGCPVLGTATRWIGVLGGVHVHDSRPSIPAPLARFSTRWPGFGSLRNMFLPPGPRNVFHATRAHNRPSSRGSEVPGPGPCLCSGMRYFVSCLRVLGTCSRVRARAGLPRPRVPA